MGTTNELSLLGGLLLWGGDAVRKRVTTRLQVAGSLRPESTDERAGASLRSAVSRLEGPVRSAVNETAMDLGLDESVVVDAGALARRLIDSNVASRDQDVSARAVAALSDDLLPGWCDDWPVIATADWRVTVRRVPQGRDSSAASHLRDVP